MKEHAREEVAVRCLREIKEVFDKHGIKYWLDWGTLLGAVRDSKIIPWDHDVDLGATEDEWDKIAATVHELEARGFSAKAANLKMGGNFFNKNIYLYRECPVGITVYRIKGNDALITSAMATNLLSEYWGFVHSLLYFPKMLVLYGLSQPAQPKSLLEKTRRQFGEINRRCLFLLPSGLKKPLSSVMWWLHTRSGIRFTQGCIPKHHFEKLDSIEFYGMTFNIPSNAENYLKLHYGKDWRTPRKDWVLQYDGVFESPDW